MSIFLDSLNDTISGSSFTKLDTKTIKSIIQNKAFYWKRVEIGNKWEWSQLNIADTGGW